MQQPSRSRSAATLRRCAGVERLPAGECGGVGQDGGERGALGRQHGVAEQALHRLNVAAELAEDFPAAELAVHEAELVGLAVEQVDGRGVDGARGEDAEAQLLGGFIERGHRHRRCAEQFGLRHVEGGGEEAAVEVAGDAVTVLPLRDLGLQ